MGRMERILGPLPSSRPIVDRPSITREPLAIVCGPAATCTSQTTVLIASSCARERSRMATVVARLGCNVLQARNANSVAKVVDRFDAVDLLIVGSKLGGAVSDRRLLVEVLRRRPSLGVFMTVSHRAPGWENGLGSRATLLPGPCTKWRLDRIVRQALERSHADAKRRGNAGCPLDASAADATQADDAPREWRR